MPRGPDLVHTHGPALRTFSLHRPPPPRTDHARDPPHDDDSRGFDSQLGELETQLDEALGGFAQALALQGEAEVLDAVLEYDLEATELTIDPAGVRIGFEAQFGTPAYGPCVPKTGAYVPSAHDPPGLTGVLPGTDAPYHVGVTISADTINEALYAAWQDTVSDRFLKASRGWDEDAWAAAEDGLRDRGWMDGDGRLTEEGARERNVIEEATDRLAAAPYERLGRDDTERLFDLARPLAVALNENGGYKRPAPMPDAFPA